MITEEQMMKRLYNLYQLYWMMSHEYSMADLMQGLKNYPNHPISFTCGFFHVDIKADITSIFNDWENGGGFPGGMIWVCYDEFCNIELFMPDYIQKLLDLAQDEELTEAYNKWLKTMNRGIIWQRK